RCRRSLARRARASAAQVNRVARRTVMHRFLLSAGLIGLVVSTAYPTVRAQGQTLVRGQAEPTTAPLEFDVVSIKRNPAGRDGMTESRTLADGTLIIVNGTLPIGSA